MSRTPQMASKVSQAPAASSAAKVEVPSVLIMNVELLGIGRFQSKGATVYVNQQNKSLFIEPEYRNIGPVTGVSVNAEQFEYYQMDLAHGLLYIVFKHNINVATIAHMLMKDAKSEDLMSSSTTLRASALRMWLAGDVDLSSVALALGKLGVVGSEPQNLAQAMFLGVKIPGRMEKDPLRKGIKRSHSPGGSLSKRHAQQLLQRVATLYDTETATDCKMLSRDGREFPAHRVILSAWSPVFTTMFSVDMSEKASGVCRMENFDGNVVKALLSFLYTGMLPDIDQIVEDVLDVADQYDIPDLRVACEKKLAGSITGKNAARYLYLAEARGLGSLKATAAKFVAKHVGDF